MHPPLSSRRCSHMGTDRTKWGCTHLRTKIVTGCIVSMGVEGTNVEPTPAQGVMVSPAHTGGPPQGRGWDWRYHPGARTLGRDTNGIDFLLISTVGDSEVGRQRTRCYMREQRCVNVQCLLRKVQCCNGKRKIRNCTRVMGMVDEFLLPLR